MLLFFTKDLVSVQVSLSVCPTPRFGSSGFISEMGLCEKTQSRSAPVLHSYRFINSHFLFQLQALLDLVCQGIQFTGFIQGRFAIKT